MSNVLIAYFTGTGNARFVAHGIRDACLKQKTRVSTINISQLSEDFNDCWNDAETIILIYPTHGFNAPPVIYKFLSQRKHYNKKHFYLLNTRGGALIGNWNTPGLSGIATLWPALLMRLYGARVRGIIPVDLPSNWTSLHPGIHKDAHQKIQSIWRRKIEEIAGAILKEKTVFRGFWSLPLDLFVSPIACLYFTFGRYALAKTFYASSTCDGCGVCAKNCPLQAISIKTGNPIGNYPAKAA